MGSTELRSALAVKSEQTQLLLTLGVTATLSAEVVLGLAIEGHV